MSADESPTDRHEGIAVLGVPMDLGADRRGVDMGASAIRYAGLADRVEGLGYTCTDEGDLSVSRPEQPPGQAVKVCEPVDEGDLSVPRPEQRNTGADPSATYVDEVGTVCERLADRVSAVRADSDLSLVLGGNHSVAIGTASGVARTESGSTGVLWVDAHADFNTPETTPSGNVHGMRLAAALGRGSLLARAGPCARPEST